MTTPLPPGMTQAQYDNGIAYARDNFRNEHAPHLHVDKRLIRERFDLAGKRVLDFGCGMGGMTLWYATNWPTATVHGLDIDGYHVAIAQDLQEQEHVENVAFEKRDVLARPLTERYDLVFLNDVAEHIPLPVLGEILKHLAERLAPGGQIFVTYPPWRSPYASHVTHVVGVPWAQFLPQSMLLRMIEENNLPLVGEEETDLLASYRGLNHLTHKKLARLTQVAGLRPVWRKSHCLANRLPGLRHVNLRGGPLDFLITKEFLLLEQAQLLSAEAERGRGC